MAGDDGSPRLRATVIRRAGADTVHFAVSVTARHCADRRALLLEGEDYRGNGVIVLLLQGDSLGPVAGSYPVTALGDSSVSRGANVAVRYVLRDVAYGYALDRGTVEVTPRRGAFSARVSGDGSELSAPVTLTAEYDRVPLAADSVPCRHQL